MALLPKPGTAEKILGELEGDQELTPEMIISALLSSKDLELKTEIDNPLAMSTLDMLRVWIKEVFDDQCADMFGEFLNWYRKNMVSNKRKSRLEVVDALIGGRTKEDRRAIESKMDKLLAH